MAVYLTLKISPLSILPDPARGRRPRRNLSRLHIGIIGRSSSKPKEMRHG
jgi:hypothetical protein